MSEINDLSTTDANNTTISGVNVGENCPFSGLNDAIRGVAGIMARWNKDINGSLTSSGTNTVTVSANQTLSAYFDGLVIAFNAGGANTGATTLNVDSVGAKKVFKNFNEELASGDIVAGQKVVVVYDSDGDSSAGAWQMISPVANAVTTTASDTAAGKIEIAIQSEVEAASSATLAMTPGRTQYHPGVAKAWVKAAESGGSYTVAASHNIASLTDSGVGDITVNIGTDFSGAHYAVSITTKYNGAMLGHVGTLAAGTAQLLITNSAASAQDTEFHVSFFGDQA